MNAVTAPIPGLIQLDTVPVASAFVREFCFQKELLDRTPEVFWRETIFAASHHEAG